MEVHRCTEEFSEGSCQSCMVCHPPTILSPRKQLRATYEDPKFPDISRQDEGDSSYVPNGCGCVSTTQFTYYSFVYLPDAPSMDWELGLACCKVPSVVVTGNNNKPSDPQKCIRLIFYGTFYFPLLLVYKAYVLSSVNQSLELKANIYWYSMFLLLLSPNLDLIVFLFWVITTDNSSDFLVWVPLRIVKIFYIWNNAQYFKIYTNVSHTLKKRWLKEQNPGKEQR